MKFYIFTGGTGYTDVYICQTFDCILKICVLHCISFIEKGKLNMTVLKIQRKAVDLAKLLCVATPLTPGGSSLKHTGFFHTKTEKA